MTSLQKNGHLFLSIFGNLGPKFYLFVLGFSYAVTCSKTTYFFIKKKNNFNRGTFLGRKIEEHVPKSRKMFRLKHFT